MGFIHFERGIVMGRMTCVALAGAFAFTGSLAVRANDTGFASSHTLRREGGRTCFADHWHGGNASAGSKVVAYTAAMKIWYDTTAGEYGSDWAKWGKSAGKKIAYAKSADTWTATVDSRPCK